MKKIDFKNKKVKILLVVLVAIIFIGGTYAYWRLTLTQTEQNELASACFDITISDEQNDINLQKAAPISDEEGMSLTPYTFTITNNCSTFASYSVNLELLNTILEANRLSAGFVKVMLDENTPVVLNTNTSVTPTLSDAYEAYELGAGYLDANEEVTYNLRLWIDGNVTVEDGAMNKQLESKITITASYLDHMPSDYEKCVADYGADSPQCQIMAQLDTTGACPTVNDDGTVNVTSAESTNGYICSAPDDYGTSYYFRGNVTNNYVKFAGFYWRILRINGDGSIRMIYAGDADVIDALDNKTEVLANGYNDEDTGYTQIGESDYNSSWNDNAYVGYMYGTTGASTYEETHANTTNSTIKTVVDEWYEENIANHPEYTQYISDTLFCNDRSFASNNTGTGAGTSKTYYRWYYSPWDGIGTQYPRLTCAQQNDRFTVEDTQMGNGALTYPVGLLTIDEVYLAGGSDWRDSGYYLYTGNNYWTMSPSYFYGSYAYMRYVDTSGNAGYNISMIYSYGVRPVLNLKSGSLTQGSGTVLDPYLV